MRLSERALANASAVVMGVLYLFCGLAVALTPQLSQSVAVSWFHGIDISQIWSSKAFPGNFLLGFVTAVGGSWALGWLFAWVYNKFIGK